jgi:hypothetical protein
MKIVFLIQQQGFARLQVFKGQGKMGIGPCQQILNILL